MSKAEQTRQLIVEKTAPIFNKKGYAGTSISDMTEATGLTKGSIYGNFENKDEVAIAAFEHNVRKVQGIVRAEMEKRKTMREKLLVYAEVYSQNAGFPEGGCPILNTSVESDDTHEDLRKKAAAVVVSWKEQIMSLLKQGAEQKEFRHVGDPEQMALSIIAAIEGAIMIAKVTGKGQYKKLVLQQVAGMIQQLE